MVCASIGRRGQDLTEILTDSCAAVTKWAIDLQKKKKKQNKKTNKTTQNPTNCFRKLVLDRLGPFQ